MVGPKKKTPAEELIESLLNDMGEKPPADSNDYDQSPAGGGVHNDDPLGGLVLRDDNGDKGFVLTNDDTNQYDANTKSEFENTRVDKDDARTIIKFSLEDSEANNNLAKAMGAMAAEDAMKKQNPLPVETTLAIEPERVPPAVHPHPPDRQSTSIDTKVRNENIKTKVVDVEPPAPKPNLTKSTGDFEKTVAVAGYQGRSNSDYDDKVKISVGQNRVSSGYQAWSSGGSADSNLGQAENLRIAQEKIMELEQENDKFRLQNEELMAASEIIKERSDLLSAQLNEYKNDREGLAESFKNEIVLLKNHLARKESELQRAHIKTEELDSRLKFDMKKIRIRERELENRLELIRAEKNAVVKNKDEQILDLRRKMDVLQMEVESYRQKCVELNKSVESSQESFKRTTRALRLAMANLELQEENKAPLKKVD